MAETGQETGTQALIRLVLKKSALGVFLLSAVMAGVIAWRVSGRIDAPGFLSIFAWQLAVWLPWIAYYAGLRYITSRQSTRQAVAAARIALLIAAALLIAVSHLAWYWQISSHFSPLLGMEFTRFGVYPFFFIFWFLIDVLIVATIVISENGTSPGSGEPDRDNYTSHFAVRKGRAQHIVRTEDLTWIEAQGYYAGLHTADAVFLIRKSLNALEKELDPDQFVRVHRSTIVNIDQIRTVQSTPGGATSISLIQGGNRNVSREGRRRLKDILKSRA